MDAKLCLEMLFRRVFRETSIRREGVGTTPHTQHRTINPPSLVDFFKFYSKNIKTPDSQNFREKLKKKLFQFSENRLINNDATLCNKFFATPLKKQYIFYFSLGNCISHFSALFL